MKFAIQISASPVRSHAAMTGFQFSKAALMAGHEIVRVFFYHDGVYNAFISARPGETVVPDWTGLAQEHSVELVFCIAADERRGLTGASTGAGQAAGTPLAGFIAGGLGLWVDACLRAGRVVRFGE